MNTKLGIFAVFSLSLLMLTPAYASVTSFSLDRSFYTIDETFTFSGEQEGKETVYIIIRDSSGNFKGMLSDPAPGQGEFSVIPRPVENFFSSQGIYNATAFTDSQKEEEGLTIKIEYDGKKIFEMPDFVLELKPISDKEIDELKTVSFTVSITDSSVEDEVYSLEKNPPSGATIDSSTGKFVWTPSGSHGNNPGAEYTFDIVVTRGSQTDRQTVTITVNEPVAVNPEPKETTETVPEPKEAVPEPKEAVPEPKELEIPAPFVDETKDPQSYVDRYNDEEGYKKWFDDNYSEYSSIYQAVGLEEPLEIPAPFVDETKDPQSYVDRYNDEEGYKKWFDDNYSEYSSIYQAVGLEEPKVLAPFVDPNLDPQYYVERYNNEITYKDWFDKTYPEMTIFEAVGLGEPKIVEKEFGECGVGTNLVNGECTVIPIESNDGGGCLIATAAYGSEMAPQVQLLREIRDNQLMNTESGMSFMTGFNQIYYSFSPYIADMQRENPMFKEAIKIGITPLLSSLSVMKYAESESQVLGYGVGVILMNIGIYFAVPAMLFFGIKKVRRVRF
ncbi:CFI-box-CTERM domain-containing protein [Nitrosopumilus maritimus]|uniref:Ig family protein n=1 Tax=Nitrosopumilus maritimus (strain SCM1) TaxID=436308 RepID=A9A2Z9_NITMS|nr:CFI-box-CTERM domain-containing protein [Nitrosopumilus maritimus]ABX12127.1 Ig family protein [Nitrosopumilus maritimus SCM1]